jgi:hypothetical protein
LHITLVKKILASGEPCKKCKDVEERLKRGGHWARIDEVVIADERDASSPGIRSAEELGVTLAPFFVVASEGSVQVYTLYFKFVKEVLEAPTTASEANQELLQNNPDLDFI